MSMKIKKMVREGVGTDSTQTTKIAALESAIGASDTTAGSLKKRCKDLETAIGDESTAASILGRIKALEDAASGGDS